MKNALVCVVVVFSLLICVVLVLPKKQETVIPITQLPPVVEVTPPPVKEKTIEDAITSITEKELTESLSYLASDELEGRMTGKKGNVLAAEFIKKQFESYGLEAMYHKFTAADINTRISGVNPGPKKEVGDNFSQNIYAVIEGSDPILKNEIVVIGAHMDHIGYGPSMSRARREIAIHPGADDNASGTVALMEIAQAFSMLKGKVKRTIVFQAYSAEEMGLHGSRFYCEHPLFPKDRPSIKSHVFMLNMDMVGYLGKGQYFASWGGGDSSLEIDKIIRELNSKYSFARKITSKGGGGSDHASFFNKEVPVAFLHTGLHAYYHTPEDTADKINYKGIEDVARYAFELAYRVANDDKAPKFNYEGFKAMEYTHDHGHPEQPFHSYHTHPHPHPH